MKKMFTATVVSVALVASAAAMAGTSKRHSHQQHHKHQPVTQVAVPKTTAVNINEADAGQLASLKGLGPKKAQAIVNYRKAKGDFASVEDLAKVKGIGDKFIARLQKQNPGVLTAE